MLASGFPDHVTQLSHNGRITKLFQNIGIFDTSPGNFIKSTRLTAPFLLKIETQLTAFRRILKQRNSVSNPFLCP